MGFQTHAEGTLTADGTEQVVSEISEVSRFSGYVSLAKMQAGDSVVIRQYTKLFATWEKYGEVTYSNAQAEPVIYFTPKEIASAIRVTLEQTAGPSRTFDYKFIKEVPIIEIKVGGAYFKV